MKKSNQIITLAIFTAILTLIVAASSTPVGSLLLLVGAPVASALLTMRAGFGSSLLAGAVACAIASQLATVFAAVAAVPFLVMGCIIGYRLGKGDDLLYTGLYATMSSAVTLALLFFYINILGAVSAGDVTEYIRVSLMRGFASQSIGIDPAVFSALVELFILLIPSGIVFFHFLVGVVSTQIAGSLARRMGFPNNARTFGELILSPQVKNFTIGISLVVYLLLIMGVNNPFFTNINSLILYIASAVGIAGILGLIFSPNRSKMLILGCAVFGHFLLGPSMFYLYAIIDSHYDFRGIRNQNRGSL